MKLKYPNHPKYTAINLIYVPVFLFMVFVAVDLALLYRDGTVEETWKPVIAAVFALYMGFRAVYGIRQTIQFRSTE